MEIVGLVASSLAYGRVAQILKSVQAVLNVLTDHPHEYLQQASPRAIRKSVKGFKHRFTTDADMADLLVGIKSVLKEYGSLNDCFLSGLNKKDENILTALSAFVDTFGGGSYLLPHPDGGSACKRLNLFLRWMVRKDAVDPGAWSGVAKRQLIVPLDVHMGRIGRDFGMTARKTAGMKMALEITACFREISKSDPVKYDFALTRFGIRDDMDVSDLSIRD